MSDSLFIVSKSIEVDAVFLWSCGDGCCSNDEQTTVFFREGDTIHLVDDRYGYHKDQLAVVGKEEDGEEVRLYKWRIQELLDEGFIQHKI